MLISGYQNTGTPQNPTFDELAVGSYVIEPTDYTLNNESFFFASRLRLERFLKTQDLIVLL